MERFTVEEINLICIYNAGVRVQLLSDMRAALPDIDDPEIRSVADRVINKLEKMTDAEFSGISFEPIRPLSYSEDESGGF